MNFTLKLFNNLVTIKDENTGFDVNPFNYDLPSHVSALADLLLLTCGYINEQNDFKQNPNRNSDITR